MRAQEAEDASEDVDTARTSLAQARSALGDLAAALAEEGFTGAAQATAALMDRGDDCAGKGTVTINNNKPGYGYTYSVNGGTPGTSNVLSNLDPGTYTITIKYKDNNPPAKNVLFLEDFGAGANKIGRAHV